MSSGTASRRSSPTTSREDGLYIARHVLGDGWLQIGDKRAAWRFTPREGLR